MRLLSKISRIISITFFVLLPRITYALDTGIERTRQEAGIPDLSVGVFIGRIVQIVLSLLGVIAFIFFFYGGLLWMTSGGNEETIRKAKSTLSSAAIGIVIVLAAWAFTFYIITQVKARFGN